MSTPSPSSRMSLLTDEEMEPYVRKKRGSQEAKKKMEGLNEDEQNMLRTSINSRERKRMHDLNDAHEELRSCLPYGQEVNSRKLSKISTIMLASNWIRHLTQENARLKSEVEQLRKQTNNDNTKNNNNNAQNTSSQTLSQTALPAPNSQHIGGPLAQLAPVMQLAPMPFACMKVFGHQQCFCVACLTSGSSKENRKNQ